MVQINYKAISWCAVFLSVALFVVFLFPWDFNSISISDIWRALGKTASIVSIIFILFSRYLWHRWPFKLLVPIPFLNGQWDGTVTYEWEGQKHTKPISLSIRQTLFFIHLKVKTDESTSLSYSASFNINEPRQEKELIYSYSNEPSIQNRSKSPIHYGAAKLSISDDNQELVGYYWTDRKTLGGLNFKKR